MVSGLTPNPHSFALPRSRRVQQRRHYSSSTSIALANNAILSLNQLSNSCNINHYSSSPASHRHQLQPPTIHRCHRHVYDSCDHFRRFDSSSVSSSGDVSFDIDDQRILNDSFGYSSAVAVRTIVADSVSLPKEAGTANLLDVLPPHLVSLYSKPKQLLVPPATSLYKKRPVLLSSPRTISDSHSTNDESWYDCIHNQTQGRQWSLRC